MMIEFVKIIITESKGQLGAGIQNALKSKTCEARLLNKICNGAGYLMLNSKKFNVCNKNVQFGCY